MPLVRRAAQVQTVEVQRGRDVLGDDLGQRPARDPAHDLADQPPVGQGVVAGAGAGLVGRLLPGQGVHHVLPVEHVVGALDDAADAVQARPSG